MKTFIALILICSLITTGNAQPSLQWQRCLGGSAADKSFCILQKPDSSFVFAGQSSSNDFFVSGNHGQSDFWVSGLDGSGYLLWQHCFGGSSSDIGRAAGLTMDGGMILAGKTQSNDGDVTGNNGFSDFWLVKLDAAGNLQWQKCFGGSSVDECRAVCQTSDSGYIAAGLTVSNNGNVSGNHGVSDMWVIKTDVLGNLQWQQCLGGTGGEEAYSICQTSDGGYMVAGNSGSNNGNVSANHGNLDTWLVRLNANGGIVWEHSYGGTSAESAACVVETYDGGFAVAGITNSNDGDVNGNHGGLSDIWVFRTDASGILLWQKCLGGSLDDQGNFISETADDGLLIGGHSNSTNGDLTSNHGVYDQWLVKLDGSGNLQWQKCFGGPGSEECFSVIETLDGGFISAGSSDQNGDDVNGISGLSDCWIVKTGAISRIQNEYAFAETSELFPNPSHGLFTMKSKMFASFEIIDVFGHCILKGQSEYDATSLDLSSSPKGIYLLEISCKGINTVHKLIIL